MKSQFTRMGNHAINWDNVQYIERKNQGSGYAFDVYFTGREKPMTFNASTTEAKALANWWENRVPELSDGTEAIPIA